VETREELFKLTQLATGIELNDGTSIEILPTIWIFLTPQTARIERFHQNAGRL